MTGHLDILGVGDASFRHLVSLNPPWSLGNAYMLPEETRITGAARLVVREGRLAEARFLPAWIEGDSAPVMLGAADPRFERVRAYLEEVTVSEGFSTLFEAHGDELVIRPEGVGAAEALDGGGRRF